MGLIRKNPSAPAESERRQHDRSPEELLGQLRDGSASERRWAARDLATAPNVAAALCDAFGDERELSVRAAIVDTLLAIGNEEVVCGILPYLHSEDASRRNAAVEVLQQLPDVAAKYIQDLLAHPDSDIRIFAINICQNLRHAPSAEWLLNVIRTDEHINVVATALDGIAEIGTPEMIDELMDARQRFAGDPFICFAVDQAILRIRG